MKTRDEIMESANASTGAIQVGWMLKLLLEVLLDIRDITMEIRDQKPSEE